MVDTATLLVELRTEELPPKSLQRLSAAFADGVLEGLRAEGFLTEASLATPYATPRRLAVSITAVLGRQPDREIERKGPSLAAGLDAEGRPTKALQGFARACGVEVEQLGRGHDGKQDCFVFHSRKAGEPLAAHLAAVVQAALKRLPIPKLMRWGDGEAEFVRPAHGLVCLHGGEVVPGRVLDLDAGRATCGHRFMGEGAFDIPHADAYADTLRARGSVEPDFAARRERIRAGLTEAAGAERALVSDALLDEVTALVEHPVVLKGAFDAAFLAVPQECLILSMQSHQKYFPLLDAGGRLLPRFLVVSNLAAPDPEVIVRGNERVLRARLSDARFFYDQDRKTRLEDRVPRLDEVVYHNRLGSQGERVRRLARLAAAIARELNADEALAERAARLAKADLVTDMVGEFPELQGTMGKYYALHDGEDARVAEAIEAHYRPKFAGDELPAGNIALAVALADRLDALTGIFGIGLTPTGDKDPFALRRAALGVLRMLMERGLPLDLAKLLELAHAQFDREQLTDSTPVDVFQFMLERLRVYLRDQGHAADEVEAVVAQRPSRVDRVPARLAAVREFRKLPEAEALAAANKRIQNILRKAETVGETVDADLLREDAERHLHQVLLEVTPRVETCLAGLDYTAALTELAGTRAAVDRFFDEVMVMAEEPLLRANRLALLGQLGRTMNCVADIAQLSG
ncbi:MAG: glycine--tRNA ligase subunit beta [Thiobacillaceae bacterium]|nr:glycine--tRNA ligase subunit beta [Thiobacillaceae bacterium]